MYMTEWRGRLDPADRSGEADYKIDGETLTMQMPSFEHAQGLDSLLSMAFAQGKQFAYRAVRSHVLDSLERADQAHSLTMPTPSPKP